MSVQVFERKRKKKSAASVTGASSISTSWESIASENPTEAVEQEQPSQSTTEVPRVSTNELVKIRFVLRTDRPLEKDEALTITSVKLKVGETEMDITQNISWVKQDPSTGEFVGEYKTVFDKPGEHSIQLGVQYNLVKGASQYSSPLIWSEPMRINVELGEEKVIELSIMSELPRAATTAVSASTEEKVRQHLYL